MVKILTSAKSTKTKHPKRKTTPLLLFFLFFSFQLFAQIPAGYYESASGQSGDQLKASLHNIIKGHITFPYSASSTDVWDILKEADKDPNDPSKVIGIYSGFSMDADAEYASGSGWNREHVWAKSRGDFGTSQGPGTDCHHLRAADISTNSARNNRNFDYADNFYIDATGTYNGPTESKTSTSSYVWEPRDEVKGDVARMIFYMATRYEGDSGEPDLELTETLLDNGDKSPFHARLSVLLEWHQLDPVSEAERSRNDIIYSYQNNRNPFIDHPEFVCLIYSCDGETVNTAPSFVSTALTSITAGETYQYIISATDSESDPITFSATTLPSWLSLTDNGNGSALLTGLSTSAEIGSHEVVLEVSDGSLNTQQSFTITVSSSNQGGNGKATDLFISEYIEGSSFNKGLEIANFTGDIVDLGNYSLFKQTNGSGEWSSELTLSGSLADGEVYVIVHPSADPIMQSKADLVTGVGALTFNGNDPVALFKSGNLIDELGFFNDPSDFAKDVTLVRKPTINSPNTIYNPEEWEILEKDTFTNLGSHTIDLGSGEPDTEAPSVPQNLQKSNITPSSFQISWDASSDDVGVIAYEVFLEGVSKGIIGNTTFTFTELMFGTSYEVKVSAIDAAGNSSALSLGITVTTLAGPDVEAPSKPSNLVATNITDTGFELNWSASYDNVGVESYDIYLDDTFVANVSNTTYQFSDLQEQTSYGLVVVAKDAAGNESVESEVLVVTTLTSPDTVPPSVPKNLQSSEITTTSFKLTWEASTDNVGVTAYDVYLDNAMVATVASTSYNFIALEKERMYSLFIIAKDAAGNSSAKSEVLNVTTKSVPDTEAPAAVTNISAIDVGINEISINWDAASDNVGVTEYALYLEGIWIDKTNQLSYSFLGLNESTTYSIGVEALDAAGNVSIRSTLTVTTADSQSQGPQIISESYFESGWDDWVSGGVNAGYYSGSYAFEGNSAVKITDDNGEASSITSLAIDVNSFNQIAVEFYFYSNRMDYGDEFKLAYFDGGSWNTISTFTEGIDFSDKSFYLATVYVDRNFFSFPTNAQFRIQGLADSKRDQLYFDQITIIGLSSSSAIRQTSEGLLTTIERVGGEVSVESIFSVYPNPTTSGYIQLKKEYDEETEVSIRLFDSRGNQVYQIKELVSEGYFQPVLNVTNLKTGVYFIQLIDQVGYQELKKILIR